MTQTAHALAQNIHQAFRYRERIVVFLIGIIAVAATAYIFYVREAVMNVVARQHVTSAIQASNSTLSNLENQYFVLKNSITMDMAIANGFEPTKVNAFISLNPQPSGAAGLAYNETKY